MYIIEPSVPAAVPITAHPMHNINTVCGGNTTLVRFKER